MRACSLIGRNRLPFLDIISSAILGGCRGTAISGRVYRSLVPLRQKRIGNGHCDHNPGGHGPDHQVGQRSRQGMKANSTATATTRDQDTTFQTFSLNIA